MTFSDGNEGSEVTYFYVVQRASDCRQSRPKAVVGGAFVALQNSGHIDTVKHPAQMYAPSRFRPRLLHIVGGARGRIRPKAVNISLYPSDQHACLGSAQNLLRATSAITARQRLQSLVTARVSLRDSPYVRGYFPSMNAAVSTYLDLRRYW